jgi:hypothetical protein
VSCEQEDFEVHAEVSRLTDTEGGPVTGYAADLRVNCTRCKEPFRWNGLPVGLSPARPMVSVDGLELRAPLAPASAPEDFGLHRPGFHVRYVPGSGG